MVNTYFQRPSQSSFFKSSAENSTNSRRTYALTLTFPFCKMAIIVYHANILLLDNHTSIISFARIVSIINVALMNIETKVILASFLNNSTANLTLQGNPQSYWWPKIMCRFGPFVQNLLHINTIIRIISWVHLMANFMYIDRNWREHYRFK